MSRKIYLYVKRHTKSGLKYFGRTVKNPYEYLGSGVYWLSHIKFHGIEHVVTDEIFYFYSQKKCTNFAVKFSIEHDIVNSEEWANLVTEIGYSVAHSETTKEKISKSKRGKGMTSAVKLLRRKQWDERKHTLSFAGGHHSEEAKKRIKDARLGTVFSEETRKKLSEAAKRREAKKKEIGNNTSPMKGKKHTEETKQKIRLARKGQKPTREALENRAEGRRIWFQRRKDLGLPLNGKRSKRKTKNE